MTGEVSPAGRGELRASHEDRDAVVEQLRTAAGDGRLTADELDVRLEAVLTARTYSELAALTADLPAAGVTSGNVKLDFTEAIITGGTLRIDADVRSGQLLLVTRPGIVVDADDVSVSSGSIKAPTPWAPHVTEILRIEVAGRVRSGSILARPPRRTFWQWLRREQRPYQSALG